MARIHVTPYMRTNHETAIHEEVLRKWILAIANDDDVLVRHLLETSTARSDMWQQKLLETHLVFPQLFSSRIQPMKQFTATDYAPDTAWCLAATCDSRKVMRVLLDYGTNVMQVTSTNNNVLHALSALASTGTEEEEEGVIATVSYIRTILEPGVYQKLLLAENGDGLRPLELASHLGAFSLFMFFFNTPGIYITKEEDCVLYKLQYFDITEYTTGSRYFQCPLYAMTYIEESRISRTSVKEVYLNDPINSWIKAVYAVNTPFIVVWALLRAAYIYLFLQCDLKIVPLCTGNSTCAHTNVHSVETNLILYWLVFGMSVLMIAIDLNEFIGHMICRPRWLKRVVYGSKKVGMRRNFYRITHFGAVLIVAIITAVTLISYTINGQFGHIGQYGVIAAVYGFVWSALYFVQLLPMIGHYVMAVHGMLKDFANFSLLLIIFFVTYSFGFYKLMHTSETLPEFSTALRSLYGTFQVMLNMVNFRKVMGEKGPGVFLLHISFVLMITILLMNFLIATLSSSYEHVMTYRAVFIKLQTLAVTMTADRRFQRLLPSLRNCLLRRYLVHQNGRYYITCLINSKFSRVLGPSDNRH